MRTATCTESDAEGNGLRVIHSTLRSTNEEIQVRVNNMAKHVPGRELPWFSLLHSSKQARQCHQKGEQKDRKTMRVAGV